MPYRFTKNYDVILYKIMPGIIHDLRNPLAVLKLNNYYLKLLEDIPEEIKGTIEDSSTAITNLQKSLEHLSELFSNKEKVLCSINDLLDSAIQLTSAIAKKQKVKVDFKPDDSISPIYIEKTSVLFAAIHIIIAAIDGGKNAIKISTELIENKIRLIFEGPEKNLNEPLPAEQKKEALKICEEILSNVNCKVEIKNSKINGSIIIIIFELNNEES